LIQFKENRRLSVFTKPLSQVAVENCSEPLSLFERRGNLQQNPNEINKATTTHEKNSTIPGLGSLLVLAVTTSVYAGDYSPTSLVRASLDSFNEWLRKDDPYMAAWDIGVQTRLRYEIQDNFAIAGSPGSMDFSRITEPTWTIRFSWSVCGRGSAYTGTWFSVFVEGRHSSTTGDDRNPNLESDGPIDLHQAYLTLGNHKEFPLSSRSAARNSAMATSD